MPSQNVVSLQSQVKRLTKERDAIARKYDAAMALLAKRVDLMVKMTDEIKRLREEHETI